MNATRLRLRSRADKDIQKAEAGEKIAVAFINAIEQALQEIRRRPEAGSPRYAHELDLPGLRYWMVKRHPYLIFYALLQNTVDVWRVLHASRDIPDWMRSEKSADDPQRA